MTRREQLAEMDCDLDTSVPDWIIDHPESAAVFDELRIDTSCPGKSLEYICRQHGFNPKAVLRRLLQIVKVTTLKEDAD